MHHALRANIETKIGYAYEIIIIDNSERNYNIFEAYNLGVKRSKGNILCFLHDDILFHTNNWGVKVIRHFTNPNVGAIGIAGTPYLTKTPGSWWAGGLINQQICYQEDAELKVNTRYLRNKKEDIKQVVALDGVWFCVKRELFEKIKFDDENFKDFHFYDVDLSMQINQLGYKLFTIYDILIEHNSKGNINKHWIENAKKFTQKWKNMLPFYCMNISFKMACLAELRTVREFSKILEGHGISISQSNVFAIRQILANHKLYIYYRTPKYLLIFLKNVIRKR